MIKKSQASVLVVEDSLAAAKRLQFCLQRAGFTVEIAKDGEQALEMARQKPFDVVVTDEQMPVMTGRQLCQHLRNDDQYARTPIIFLTANLSAMDADELKDDLRISVTLGKPFSPELLVRAVEAELATKRTAENVAD